MTHEPGEPRAHVARHFTPAPPPVLGVAVSGGSDSTALLTALADWGGAPLLVATVDHGLRPEAAAEAAQVAALCRRLGLPHEVLRWEAPDGCRGNLMAAARDARYRLLAGWARAQGIADVALGHTADDVAETFVMRLRRGAGIDGLSAMAARFERGGVRFHRPLLAVRRADLRADLAARGIGWLDDPTNADARFERARVRDAMAGLALDSAALAGTARALRAAREALEAVTAQVAHSCVTLDRGDVLLARGTLGRQPDEIARRLMLAALRHVSGAGYGPRGAELDRLMQDLERPGTLMGCRILPERAHLRVTREWRAVAACQAPVGAIWDGRWRVQGPGVPGPAEQKRHVAALGEAGLALCPDRKLTGLPAASLMASPAVWEADGGLVAAPLAGLGAGYSLGMTRPWALHTGPF